MPYPVVGLLGLLVMRTMAPPLLVPCTNVAGLIHASSFQLSIAVSGVPAGFPYAVEPSKYAAVPESVLRAPAWPRLNAPAYVAVLPPPDWSNAFVPDRSPSRPSPT